MTDRNLYGDELCSCCWLPLYSCGKAGQARLDAIERRQGFRVIEGDAA